MKRFTVNCQFGAEKAPFHIYVGEPSPTLHPLFFQETWLADERSGAIPPEVMDNFGKLQKIAIEHGVSFEELCAYALGTSNGIPPAPSEAPPPVDAGGA
jgi:hypothetical protein